jgi:hypothetical protein
VTAIFSKYRLLFFCRQIMNYDVKILLQMIQKWPKVVIFHYALSLKPDWKTKMYIKIVRLWKQKKRRKQKIIFSPQFFFVPKSCGAIIFSCGIISTPLISQIFCVLDKEKELISFFSKQHFQIEKKIYKLISTTQQNQFRGISTKMMEKTKKKEI